LLTAIKPAYFVAYQLILSILNYKRVVCSQYLSNAHKQRKVAHHMDDRRRYKRRDSIAVQVKQSGQDAMLLFTGNISEGGMYLEARDDIALPEVGEELIITLADELAGDNPPAMRAKVVHRNKGGFGVQFLGPANT
jgi:hypothetical protein